MPTTLMNHGVVSQQSNNFTLTYDYEGSDTAITDTSTVKEFWDDLVFVGREQPVEFQVGINWTTTISGPGTSDAEMSYRVNGGSWNLVVNESTSTSGTYYITNIDYNDTIDIRLKAEIDGVGNSCQIDTTLINGSITRGTGTVTASGTTTWSKSVSL